MTHFTQILQQQYFQDSRGLVNMIIILLFDGSVIITLNLTFKNGEIPFMSIGLSYAVVALLTCKYGRNSILFIQFPLPAWIIPWILILCKYMMGYESILELFGIVTGYVTWISLKMIGIDTQRHPNNSEIRMARNAFFDNISN